MQPQPSLLIVKRIIVTNLSVQAVPDAGESAQLIDDCEIEVLQHPQGVRLWNVVMTLSFGKGETPQKYVGKVQLVGEFSISEKETISAEAAENLVNINGPAVLYSSAREILFAVTARSLYGAWSLPSVTFIGRKKKPEPTVASLQMELPKVEAVT